MGSVGTFISPFHVLTALHCLKDNQNVMFHNRKRETATLSTYSSPFVAQSENLDLVIAEMSHPIGFEHILCAHRSNMNYRGHGYLTSRFCNEGIQVYEIESVVDLEGVEEPYFSRFNTHANQVAQGFSGSPLLSAEDGKIVSIVTHTEGLREEITQAEALSGQKVNVPFPFCGPKPELFSSFISEHASEVKLQMP